MPCLPIHFLIIVHLHPFGTHSALIQHSSQYMQAQSAPIRHSFSTHSALIVIHASPFSTHSALISIHPFSTHLYTCKPIQHSFSTHLNTPIQHSSQYMQAQWTDVHHSLDICAPRTDTLFQKLLPKMGTCQVPSIGFVATTHYGTQPACIQEAGWLIHDNMSLCL
jgi:hypothetical protein